MKTMNNQNTEQEKKENKMPLPTQAALFFRGFAGFYLLYLVYQMFAESPEEEPSVIIIIFSILFTIVGIFLLFVTVRGFLRGEYVGGKADISNEMEDSGEENSEVTRNEIEDNEVENNEMTGNEIEDSGVENSEVTRNEMEDSEEAEVIEPVEEKGVQDES